MVYQDASIQSFYTPLSSSHESREAVNNSINCSLDDYPKDGTDIIMPLTLDKRQSRVCYEDAFIGSLSPGPGCIALLGRIVNFFNLPTPSKMPQAAKGCLKLIVKDDTGAMAVRTLPIFNYW